ncbi:MAG: electron transfer flavoprotein subunit beta/FixA family protein [Dissulfuribacterales bacterium]
MLNIAVCIKQVPDARTVRFDKETGMMIRDGVETVINPVDLNALEAALAIKDSHGAQIHVLTMGPPSADKALRDALSMGADFAYLLSDRAFAGADTLATTRVLAKAIQKIGPMDMVICGNQSVDGDTAQVGPGLAVRLDMPSVAYVSALELKPEGLECRRMTGYGHDSVLVRLPALVTVMPSINTHRMPSLKGKMKAKSAAIPVWNADALGLSADEIGLVGSPTRVLNIFVRSFEARKERLEGDTETQVSALCERLAAAGVL